MPQTPAGSVCIASGFHIRTPLVAEAGSGDGVVMVAPEHARKALNLRRKVARLCDMDVQLSVGLCAEPIYQRRHQRMRVFY